MGALKPAGWFLPWNDYHGYQQVAPGFEGTGETIPLYQLPPGYVILSPDEVRGISEILDWAINEGVSHAINYSGKTEAAIRSLKGGRDAQ